MTSYTVYLPPAGASERETQDKVRFIADAGALLALVFPALWLLFNRLWYGFVVYLVIAAGLGLLARTLASPLPAVLSLIPALYLFLEGRELVRRRLERKGWRFAGVVDADNEEEAEARWFDERRPVAPLPAGALPAAALAPLSPAAPSVGGETPPAIGIFGQ